jgi:hypothetical protein
MVFEQADAKGFLLAGAHRLKADVPDLVDSIFHQVHTAWVGPAAQVAAWQIHGFAKAKHSFPNNAHVVASTGDGGIAPEVEHLDAMFEVHGLPSYVFNDDPPKSPVNKRLNGNVPGRTFTSLAATTNEQGRHSRSLGGSFVHVELESQVRLDTDQRERAAAVIAAAMDGEPARRERSIVAHENVVLAAHETTSPATSSAADAEQATTKPAAQETASVPRIAAKNERPDGVRVEAGHAGRTADLVQ